MTFIDSLLTFLRDRRTIHKQDRTEISSYLRKIADCCLVFRDSFNRILAENQQNYSKAEVSILEEQADLVEEYLHRVRSVLGGRVDSETLDEVAVTVARIITVEVPLINIGKGHVIGGGEQPAAIVERLEQSWHKCMIFNVVLWDGYLNEEGQYIHVPIKIVPTAPVDNFIGLVEWGISERASQIYGNDPSDIEKAMAKEKYIYEELKKFHQELRKSQMPAVGEFLKNLSKLHAKLRVLADAVDSGASV